MLNGSESLQHWNYIDFEPLRGGFDLGRASCDKYNLVTDFVNRRKFNTLECVKLKCVEEKQHEG